MKTNIIANNTVINTIMKTYLKYICAVLLVIGTSAHAWGAGEYSVTINHTLTGCTQHAGNATSFMSNSSSTLSMYYDISSGYTGEGATLSLLTGSTSVASYLYSWEESSTGLYKLDIYLGSITIGSNQFYINISCPSAGGGGGGGSSHTVSFSVGYGSAPSNQTGSSITLPSIPAVCTVAADARWQPYGWSTASVAANSSSASIVGEPGDTYNPDQNRTLYAVYQKPGTELTTSTEFVLQSSERSTSNMPSSGYALLLNVKNGTSSISNTISSSNSAYIACIGSGEVTGDGSTKQTTENANCIWEINSPSSGVYTFRNVVSGKYLGLNSDGNGVLLASVTTYAQWTVNSASADGFYLTNVGKAGYFLNYNSTHGWKGASTKDGTKDNIYIFQPASITVSGTKYQSSLTCVADQYHVYYSAGCDMAEITSGSVPVDGGTYSFGDDVTVAANTLVRDGYTFEGWLSSYNGNTYNGDGTDDFYMGDEDVTLTAQWEEEACTARTLSFANGTSDKTIYKADGTTYTNAAAPSTGSGYGTVTYSVTSSSPSGCATVNGSGVVSFSNYGSATITASLGANGTYCAAADVSYTVSMECKSRTLTFASSTPSVSVTTDTYTQTATKSAGDGTISYAMVQSVGSGFTIDSETGEVSFNGNAGTATITASITADATGGYCTAEGSYTLTVTPVVPTVSSFSVTSGETSMTLNGSAVTDNGGTAITAYGYIYSTTASAVGTLVLGGEGVTTAQVAAVNIAVGTPFAEKSITSLSSGTTYYVRAYATNSAGTGYSDIQTVKTVTYSNYQFSCSELTLTAHPETAGAPIFITSVANKKVRSQGYITITGSGLTPSTALTFPGLGSKFEVLTSTGGTISTDASGAINVNAYIFYTPDAGDTEDGLDKMAGLTVSVGGAKPKQVSLVHEIIGRHLPTAGYVIAGKKDNKWYALPSNMASTSTPDPSEIAVDDINNPTIAYTDASNIYGLEGPTTSGAGNNLSTGNAQYVRLTMSIESSSGSGKPAPLFGTSGSEDASNSPKVGKSGTAIATNNLSEGWWWELKQTNTSITNPQDAKYTIKCANNNHTLSIKNSPFVWGLYASGVEELRLIPASDIPYTEAYFVEWGQHGGVIEVDKPGIDATSVVAHLGAATSSAITLSQTLTNGKSRATDYNYTVNFGDDINFAAVASNGALLTLEWKKGETVKAMSNIVVPKIIAADGVMKSIMSGDTQWETEVHVLPGVTLTANAGDFTSNDVMIKHLEIYPGATVVVTKGSQASGTLKVKTLVLRNGWTRAGEKAYDVARLYITPTTASLAKNAPSEDVWYTDWYIDYDQYYPIAVPWDVTLANITYRYCSVEPTVGPEANIRLRYYDGEGRASSGQSHIGQNWKLYGADGAASVPTKLEPSKGYALTAKRPSGKAFSILRMPLTIPSAAWTTGGEKGEVSSVHKNQVSVTGWGSGTADWYAMGWNFVANPYMCTFNGDDEEGIGGKLVDQQGKGVRYATIPDVDFRNYDQVAIADANLKPASGFFIQAENPEATYVTFASGNIVPPSAPARYTAEPTAIPEQEAYIRLSYEGGKDQMGLIIGEDYTEAYEVNADLAKVLGEGNFVKTYMQYGGMDMAYVAINGELAKEWIPVTVILPTTGEYTYSITASSEVAELEGVYLIDYYNGDKITNLIEENYIFEAEAGTISNRFAINATVGKRNTPTDIDIINAGGDINSIKPLKFLWNDKVFILHNGMLYDSTGKKVREINK